MALNIYKGLECVDAYSKDGEMTDPIFNQYDYRFDGVNGQARDELLFIKNDGINEVESITVTPADKDEGSDHLWVKLSKTLFALGAAVGGNPINLPNLDAEESISFWMRMTVPASTSDQLKQNIALRVEGTETA